jgi:O-acetyl-ADP-ribose deacetylase (regulator of RNase III)
LIHYRVGDATQPGASGEQIAQGPWVIAHVCNDANRWGAGFTHAISARWIEPAKLYRAQRDHVLGSVLFAKVTANGTVANMIAQQGYGRDGRRYLRYDALETCLITVAAHAHRTRATVHCPRIGCGLAGGDWADVEPILMRATRGLDVFVYDLPGTPNARSR